MELPIFNTFINFSRHHLCCFIIASLFDLEKSTAWNRCLQYPCFKNLCKIAQASKNSDPMPNTLFRICSHIHYFTPCSLHSQVTNPLKLSWIGVSTLDIELLGNNVQIIPQNPQRDVDSTWICKQVEVHDKAWFVLGKNTLTSDWIMLWDMWHPPLTHYQITHITREWCYVGLNLLSIPISVCYYAKICSVLSI